MSRARAVLVLAIALFAFACGGAHGTGAAARHAEHVGATGIANGRLPTAVRPLRYGLALTIDPKQSTFSGVATIRVHLGEARRSIALHGQGLRVSSVNAIVGDRRSIGGTYAPATAEGFARVDLSEPIGPGDVVVVIAYQAEMSRTLTGPYRLVDGAESYAFTHFEPLSARLAFPCFDEPSFKAPFEITLTVPEHDVAASNMPAVAEERLPGGWRRVRFAPSPPMPTYLVAWAVGPFDVVQGPALPANAVRERPLPFRGLAVKGKGGQLAYAMKHTGAILAAAEAYFGSEYPFAKLDIVAVPELDPSAMENAGLLTFRERYLLLGEDASERQRRLYASLMSHELAHMWVGNLVTMAWWDDVWLNESFATWMSGKLLDQVFPDYGGTVGSRDWEFSALQTDCLPGARPIRKPIHSSDDIEGAFDPITYGKGSSVLSMVEAWIGPRVFQRGLRLYLARHRWGNARTSDLIAALNEASGRDLTGTLLSFIEQPGIPYVRAEVSCGERSASLTLEQARYLPLGSTSTATLRWTVPVCVHFASDRGVEKRCFVLDAPRTTFDLATSVCPRWLMPNAEGDGYYRFAVSHKDLHDLLTMGFEQLDVREQYELGDSLAAAFDQGTVSAEEVFAALPTLARSPSRSVSTMPMHFLRFARDRLLDEKQKDAVRQYSASIYLPQLDTLGWQTRAKEDSEDMLRRVRIVDHLAMGMGDPRVRKEAARRAHAFLGYGPAGDGRLHHDALAPGLVGVALSVAVQEGDGALFDHLLGLFHRTSDAVLRADLLRALGSTLDPTLAARAYALAFDERLRADEIEIVLREQSHLPERRDAAWEWLARNIDALIVQMGEGASALPYYGRLFCSAEGARRVRELFEGETQRHGTTMPRTQAIPGGARGLELTLEGIALCEAKVGRYRSSAQAWFSPRQAPSLHADASVNARTDAKPARGRGPVGDGLEAGGQ